MEGKHNSSDHFQHEHHNSAGMEETHHRKESHGGWVCRKCGWTSPHPHPSAKQRRNHKKHCGKIEGFKLINLGDTEKRDGSSEEASSDEEHKSTVHPEKEGKHITSHQHQHEQPLHSAENHHKKDHHGWVCHRCGWTYPNPHPSAKHRKNHKRHCGKIEGFKLISSREKEIQGGSSDDESSDDEFTSTDDLSQTDNQVYESEKQKVLVSETEENKMQHPLAIPSDLNEGLNIKLPLGTESQKDYPPSSSEPETEKLIQFTSSTTSMDSTSLSNPKVKVTEGAVYSQGVERGTSNKPEKYTSNSGDMLHPEEEKENIIIQEAIKGPSSEGIDYTSGQKLDEQVSNVVIPDQGTNGTDSLPTLYSKEGENQQTECSSITSSSTIEHDMKDYNPDCRTADSTPENIVMPTTNIVRVANENQEAIKGSSSEGIESTSGQKLDEQASNVVILDPKTSGTDSFSTEYSTEGEKQKTDCSSITSSGTIEHDMKDYNPDRKTADSTPENILMPATDIVRDADTPVNEVANEKSAAAESHRPESMVYNHEQKITVEQPLFVNPAEYTESKEIPNLEKAKEPCSGGTEIASDQKLISQASSKIVTTNEAMSSADSPPIEYSGLGETQQNECNTPTNSSIVERCVRDSDPDSKKDYSMQGNIMLLDVDRDGHIDAKINAQESLSEAAATEVVHANSAASESVQSSARNTYSSSQDAARANSGAQLPEKELQYKHLEQGLEHPGVEQSDPFKVDNVNYKYCSATTIADNSLQLNVSSTDGHDDSLKESMDDVHGSKTESLKTCEPALWEQLLESNAKEPNNPEIYQDLGHAQQSPDNPFIYGQNFCSKEEAHPTSHNEGGRGLISEQLKNNSAEVQSELPLSNNRVEQSPITKGKGDAETLNLKENTSDRDLEAPADVFEAPSFVTLVETHNGSQGWTSHHEIQSNADLAPGGSQNGELSAEAAESESEILERHHKPLRNLLAEENMRGTQDRSKQDPPLVEQPKTSSQNSIQEVHVTDQGGTSSLNQEIAQKASNTSSKKIEEKVWNSPARLPSPKVEKQKVKVKSAWSMCLCGSGAN